MRVRLRRETTSGTVDFHDYLYEVERIGKNISGVVDLDLIHFPIDAQGRSLLALAVIDAVGNGIVIPTGRTDFSCDAGATIDDDGITGTGDGGGGYGVPIGQQGDPDGATDNPPEPPVPELQIDGASGPNETPVVGDTLTTVDICPGMYTEWYLVPANGGARIPVSAGVATPFLVGPEITGFSVLGIGRCPDPGSPDGFGPANESVTPPTLYCVGASETLGGGAYNKQIDIGPGLGTFQFTFSGVTGVPIGPGNNAYVTFAFTGAANYSYYAAAPAGAPGEVGNIAGVSTAITKSNSGSGITLVIVASGIAAESFSYSVGCTNPA